MKFKFSKNLSYQKDAIDAVVNIFDTGKNIAAPSYPPRFILKMIGATVQNALEISDGRILKNLQHIQRTNNIEPVEDLESYDFSIEMETGTGKTYVYLRTIMELSQKYLLKKFIILVPSVAIREGVIKTIEQTKEHFRDLYGSGFGYFAYDSTELSRVREFAESLDVQIMIMTIQSFNSETTVLRQTDRDDSYGEKSYLDLIAKTRPVVIMDEPQNMESELAKASIKDLDPLFKLRYSATHKELHNLLYRLTPIDAYNQQLVKKIQVFGVKDYNPNERTLKVKEILTKKGEMPKAKVVLDVKNAAGLYTLKEMSVKSGDNLYRKTNNSAYEGLLLRDVSAQYGRVELSDGNYYLLEGEMVNKEPIFRTQIHETIKAHFDKQRQVGDNIKVLSLFFIDKVDNYAKENSLVRTIFIEEFEKLKKNYPHFKNVEVGKAHKGYFASKKEKGEIVLQDTRGDSKIDKEAYDLIMKDKERLLSFNEPVAFIFSHSALKEGWDNPNVFQICTLRETNSPMRKRQEIGRGLRLPVDVNGDRIYDADINILTVVANESYQEYVATLQKEFNDSGYAEVPQPRDAQEKPIAIRINQKYIADADFKILWNKISQRTRYNLTVPTEKLVTKVVQELNNRDISNLVVTVDKVNVYFDKQGKVETIFSAEPSAGMELNHSIHIDNCVERIARETGLTRSTVGKILFKVDNLSLMFQNPEEYVRSVIVIVKGALQEMLLNEGLRYVPTGEFWEISLLFKEIEGLESKSVASGKSPYDRISFDSDGERKFAESLEHSPNVRVYTKLPRKFAVDTPFGEYVPDWAIVWKAASGDKLYLVRETKFKYKNLAMDLSLIEQLKFACGEKHFAAIGFDNFTMAQKEDLSDLI